MSSGSYYVNNRYAYDEEYSSVAAYSVSARNGIPSGLVLFEVFTISGMIEAFLVRDGCMRFSEALQICIQNLIAMMKWQSM